MTYTNNDMNDKVFKKTVELLNEAFQNGDVFFNFYYHKVKIAINSALFEYPVAKEYNSEKELRASISDILKIMNIIALGDASERDNQTDDILEKVKVVKQVIINDKLEEKMLFYTTSTSNVLESCDWQIITRQTKNLETKQIKGALLSFQYLDNTKEDSEENIVFELTKNQVEDLINDLKNLVQKME